GEKMIQCQHRVSFAAAEIGLELHNRIAPRTGEPPHGADQHLLKAFGEVCPAEEFNRIAVFVSSLPQVDLPQVRRKLGLLILSAGHVFVWRDYFAPRLQSRGYSAFDCRAGAFALLAAHLLLE